MQFPPDSPSGRPHAAAHIPAAAPGHWGTHDLPRTGDDPYRPDPRWRIALGFITLALLTLVVILQRPAPTPPGAKERAAAGMSEHMGPSIEVSLFAKLQYAIQPFAPTGPNSPGSLQASLDALAEFPMEGVDPPPAGPPEKPPPMPAPAHVRVQAAIMAAESLGGDAALHRLTIVEHVLDPASPLNADISLLRRIYGGEPAADVAASLSEPDREALIARHGMFARLALAFGDASAPVRTEAASSGWIMLLAFLFFGGAAFVCGFIGLGLLIYFWVQLGSGQLRARFTAPDRHAAASEGPTSWGWGMDPQGRLIWLEAVAVFMLGFLILGASGDVLAASFPGQAWVAFYSLIGQWALVLTLFWPVVRGMPWQRWRGELGWHRGAGFFNEVGAGIAAYLASLPVYFLMALFVALLVYLANLMGWDAAPGAEDNKLLDLAMSGNPLLIALIFLLATMWAPVVEESVFRGALYRHMRWRCSPVLAGLLTAFVFAVMHGYAPIQLLMVGVLGMVFAMMREWRGSLIAPMTAHFVHNSVVMTFVVVLFGQLS